MGGSFNETDALKLGENASTALVQKLGGELKAVMQKDGPIEAVNFCSKNALHIVEPIRCRFHCRNEMGVCLLCRGLGCIWDRLHPQTNR